VDPQLVALEPDLDGPVAIGPVRSPGDRLESGDRRRRRVTVRIAEAGRDNGHLRPDRVEEGLGARGLRAVVRDLQELDTRKAAGEELGIDALLDVAGEQEAVRTEAAEQDDRHVVDRGAAVGRVLGHPTGVRPEDPELDVVERESVSGRERPVRWPVGPQRRGPRSVAGPRPDHARLVDPTDAVPRQEEREPGDVVLVGVGEHEDVDPAVPRRQSLVKGADQAGRVGPTVDEEAPPGAALDEDAIALADVQDRHAHDARRPIHDREAEGDRRGDEGDRGEARAAGRGGSARLAPIDLPWAGWRRRPARAGRMSTA